jgi:hypothetical protein
MPVIQKYDGLTVIIAPQGDTVRVILTKKGKEQLGAGLKVKPASE